MVYVRVDESFGLSETKVNVRNRKYPLIIEAESESHAEVKGDRCLHFPVVCIK